MALPDTWTMTTPISTKTIHFCNLTDREILSLFSNEREGSYITEFVQGSDEPLQFRFHFLNAKGEFDVTKLYPFHSGEPSEESILVPLLMEHSKTLVSPVKAAIGALLALPEGKIVPRFFHPKELLPVAFDSLANAWRAVASNSILVSPPSPSPTLKVYTQNLWFQEYYLPTRTEAVIKVIEMERPDFVCLQEVTRPSLMLIAAHPLIRSRYFLSDFDTSTFLGSYSTLILSAHPIERLEQYNFPSMQARSLLVATCRVKSSSVAVATVHLESHAHNGPFRALQLSLAFPILKRLAPSAILCGDFNFCSAWPLDNARLNPAFTDCWPALHPDEPGWSEDTTRNSMLFEKEGKKFKQVRYDRMLLRYDPGFCFTTDPHRSTTWLPLEISLAGTEPIPKVGSGSPVFISDHFGLIASFQFQPQ